MGEPTEKKVQVVLVGGTEANKQALMAHFEANNVRAVDLTVPPGALRSGFLDTAVTKCAAVPILLLDVGTLGATGRTFIQKLAAGRLAKKVTAMVVAIAEQGSLKDGAYAAGCDYFTTYPFDIVATSGELRRMRAWELRREHRSLCAFTMRWKRGGDVFTGRTSDLSESAVSFAAAEAPEVGRNVEMEIHLQDFTPATKLWGRVVAGIEAPAGPGQQSIGACFLGAAAERALLAQATAAIRATEATEAKAKESGQHPSLLEDYTSREMVKWFSFLTQEGLYPHPPASAVSQRLDLPTWAAKLLPSERELFRPDEPKADASTEETVSKDTAPDTTDSAWKRAWLVARARCAYLLEKSEAEGIETRASEIEWFLGVVARSLAERTDKRFLKTGDHEAELQLIQRALGSAVALRDHHAAKKGKGELLNGVKTVDGFMAKLPRRKVVKKKIRTKSRRKSGLMSYLPSFSLRVSPAVKAVIVVLVVCGGAAGVILFQQQKTEIRQLLAISPVLASGEFIGQAPERVFIGQLNTARWSLMAADEQQKTANHIRDQLLLRQVTTGRLLVGDRVLVRIEASGVRFVLE
jgi:hypothetical protein